MTTKRRFIPLILLMLLGGCVGYARGHYMVGVESSPPPPRVVYADPRPGYVWVDGHWAWVDYRWVWYDGYYIPHRPGYLYVQGHWAHRGGRYVWVNGHWERGHHRPAPSVITRDHRGHGTATRHVRTRSHDGRAVRVKGTPSRPSRPAGKVRVRDHRR
jgi:hypothetical protein